MRPVLHIVSISKLRIVLLILIGLQLSGCSRFLFFPQKQWVRTPAQLGIEYEDVRLSGEEFGKLKPTLLTGSLPMLEVDGTTLTGSGPIAWYLAQEFKFAGSTNLDQAKIQGIIDILVDYQGKMVAAFFGSDEAVKEKAKKALEEEHTPKYLGILEKMISTDFCRYGYQDLPKKK